MTYQPSSTTVVVERQKMAIFTYKLDVSTRLLWEHIAQTSARRL